jgi:hypothetical protein
MITPNKPFSNVVNSYSVLDFGHHVKCEKSSRAVSPSLMITTHLDMGRAKKRRRAKAAAAGGGRGGGGGGARGARGATRNPLKYSKTEILYRSLPRLRPIYESKTVLFPRLHY